MISDQREETVIKEENTYATTNFTAPQKINPPSIIEKKLIKDTVVLVSLGDSRGFVHMNHLIVK